MEFDSIVSTISTVFICDKPRSPKAFQQALKAAVVSIASKTTGFSCCSAVAAGFTFATGFGVISRETDTAGFSEEAAFVSDCCDVIADLFATDFSSFLNTEKNRLFVIRLPCQNLFMMDKYFNLKLLMTLPSRSYFSSSQVIPPDRVWLLSPSRHRDISMLRSNQ